MPFPSATTFPDGDLFPGAAVLPSYFRPPTQDIPFRIEGGLYGLVTHGLSVWRIDGVWHQGFMPTAEQVAASDRFYGGGRIHRLAASERRDLINAGYGDNITELP
jgi:hypothetical protein